MPPIDPKFTGSISDLEKNKFVDAFTTRPGYPSPEVTSIPCARKSITIVESSVITYVGYAPIGSATSDAVWEIHRFYTQGSTITEDIAYGALTDREDLFEAPVLLTNLSLAFDGINDYVNFGNTFLYDVSQQWSAGVWIKQDNQAAQMAIMGKVDTGAGVNGWSLQVTTAGKLFSQFRTAGAGPNYLGNLTVPTQQWAFVMLTHGGGSNMNQGRYYLNAVADTTPGSAGIGTVLVGQDFRLGLRGTAFPWSGNMCHFQFWSKALSAAEVVQAYNAGTPPDLDSLSFAGDLVTWCRLGDGDTAPVVLDGVGTNTGTLTNMSATPFEADVP